jgi:CMP-N,N'-diacetyllegionaminic acid synthase
MRVLGLVPARGNSRRVPRKNLEQVGGTTLVRRALETACASRAFDVVALTSDDGEILAQAAGLAVAAIERPPELATATARALDVVQHALAELEGSGGVFDAVALVQCTSPFTAPEDLAGAVRLLEHSRAASVVTVMRLPASRHPLKLKVLDGDRVLPYQAEDDLTPSHELPELFVRNGSLYASRRDVIERGLLVDPDDVRGYVMPEERSLDIDTPLDLAFARFVSAREDEGASR